VITDVSDATERGTQLNFLHRLVGSLMVIGANVHFLGYGMYHRLTHPYFFFFFSFVFHQCTAVYAWSLNGTVYENLADPYVRWGILALVCFDLLGFGSTEFVRSRSYNLFLVTHIVGLIVFLFAVSPFFFIYFGMDNNRAHRHATTTLLVFPM
jgi:ferric-chelate reductase